MKIRNDWYIENQKFFSGFQRGNSFLFDITSFGVVGWGIEVFMSHL
jgi:hypothetical protein